jgi:hypothetical protein
MSHVSGVSGESGESGESTAHHVRPSTYFEWNGSLYPTLEARRRAQLQFLINTSPQINSTNLIPLLLPELDSLSQPNPIPGWQTPDGKFFLSLDQAEAHAQP